MIDFNPEKQEAIMSQELAMKFLVWAVYYNGLELSEACSFLSYKNNDGTKKFAKADAERLDRIKDVLFKCFGASSVRNASLQMKKARELGEQCPFTLESLNQLFF